MSEQASTEVKHETTAEKPTAQVVAVMGDIITIESISDKPLVKNEVVYVVPSRRQNEAVDEQLMAEVLRVRGNTADIQVFEDTRGVAVGDGILQTGQLLSVDLGPGILGMIYDGLQNPLERLAVHSRQVPAAWCCGRISGSCTHMGIHSGCQNRRQAACR